jgi:uncharacterized integral membrane protein
MRLTKQIVVGLLALLILVVVIQNTETVKTRFLWITVSMPRALLLFITALIGYAAGIFSAVVRGKGSGKKPNE